VNWNRCRRRLKGVQFNGLLRNKITVLSITSAFDAGIYVLRKLGRRGMERAMRTTDIGTFSVPTFRAYHAARKRHLRTLISGYWQRVRSRYELASLGEADLRDVGLSGAEAEFETTKPFWLK
jgi:uncharacterized protein YjiS (DUF1127 family)